VAAAVGSRLLLGRVAVVLVVIAHLLLGSQAVGVLLLNQN
jgi:hypothetical protein